MIKSRMLGLLLLMGTLVHAAGVPPALRAPSVPVIDVLTNGGFEGGHAAWIASSPSTFIVSSTNPLNGALSGVFTATAGSQTVTSAQYTVTEGLKAGPCAATLKFESPELTNLYTVQVIDGSSNILVSVQVPTSSTSQPLALPFLCPNSGTIAVRAISSGSALGLKFDDVTLGTNNLINISQASYYGGVILPSGCSLQNAGSVGHTDLLPSGCGGSTTVGNVTSFDSSVTGYVTVNNMPPGEYYVLWQGIFQNSSSATNADIIVTDGVTQGQQVNIEAGAGGVLAAPATITGHFSYSTSGTRIFKLQGSGSVTHGLIFGSTAESFSIYRYPSQSETAVRPETINWRAEAAYSGGFNFNLGTSAVSTPTEITQSGVTFVNGNSSIPVTTPCSGTNASSDSTCSTTGSSPDLGIVFNQPAAGTDEVCVTLNSFYSLNSSSTLSDSFRVVETPNNAQTVLQTATNIGVFSTDLGAVAGEDVSKPVTFCNYISFSSAGQKTLRVFYTQAVTGTVTASTVYVTGNSPYINIRPITQNIPAPILIGSIISPSSGVEIIARAHINSCASDPCTISSKSGAWLSVVNRTGTGAYTAHYSGWSSAPSCSFTTGFGAAAYSSFPTTTSFAINTYTPTSPALTDSGFDIICVGPQ